MKQDMPYRTLVTDKRYIRAQQMTAHIMHLIEPFLCKHERDKDCYREASHALMEAFHTAGVEVLTDQMRAELGLPPRDERGWTTEEILAMEERHLELMRAPVRMFAADGEVPLK